MAPINNGFDGEQHHEDDVDLVKQYLLQQQYERATKQLNELVQPVGPLLQLHASLFAVYMLQNDLTSLEVMVTSFQDIHAAATILVATILHAIPTISSSSSLPPGASSLLEEQQTPQQHVSPSKTPLIHPKIKQQICDILRQMDNGTASESDNG